MLTNRTTNDIRPKARRRASWAVALGALLALAPTAFGAQSASTRVAPPPPAPSQQPVPPEPPEDADEPEIAEPPEMPEMPEMPEPADFDFDFDFDFDADMPAVVLSQEAMEMPEVRAKIAEARAQMWAERDRMRAQRFDFAGRQRFDSRLENEKDPAVRAYYEGRNLVADSEWEKAAGKFNEVVTKYPQSKQVDASLFWYAYSLKKQGQYDAAWNATDRLIAQFPKSRWLDDVNALRLDLAPLTGHMDAISAEQRQEREDELKISALQGLMSSDPKRGLSAAQEILKPGSTSGPRLQQYAVILLSQVDDPAAIETLLQVSRNTSADPKVRRQAVLMLGQRLDDKQYGSRIFSELKNVALSGSDPEISKMAVVALGQSRDSQSLQLLVDLATSAQVLEVRKQALVQLSQRSEPAACDALIRIYDNEKDAEMRRLSIVMLAQNDCPQAADKLVQVARTADSVELRRFALIMLGQRDKPKAVGVLVQMYDSEKNETLKEGVVDGLGQMVDNKAALQKLMSIAKNEPSINLRKKAIFWIGQSRDPEALQFLADLLK